MLKRSRLALAASVTAAVTVAAVVTLHFSGATPAMFGGSHGDTAQIPGYEGLTSDQKLDRAFSLPGMHGVIAGHTGSANSHTIPDAQGYHGASPVTDFPFTVTRVIGQSSSTYPVGQVITLRVPGGATGQLSVSVEDAPSIPANADIIVFDRDQGTVAGGSSSSVIVVSSTADVFTVRGGSVVGQGSFANLAEPLDRFVSHFSH